MTTFGCTRCSRPSSLVACLNVWWHRTGARKTQDVKERDVNHHHLVVRAHFLSSKRVTVNVKKHLAV